MLNPNDLISKLSGLSLVINDGIGGFQQQPQQQPQVQTQPTNIAPQQQYTQVPAPQPTVHQSTAAQNPYVYTGQPQQPPTPPQQPPTFGLPPDVPQPQQPAQPRFMGGFRPDVPPQPQPTARPQPTNDPMAMISGAQFALGGNMPSVANGTAAMFPQSQAAQAPAPVVKQQAPQPPAPPQTPSQPTTPSAVLGSQAQPQQQPPAPTVQGGTLDTRGYFDQNIIRIESGGRQLDRNGQPLTSSAGAIGIAQVMPQTARETARAHGIQFDEHLYRTDPDYNANLGYLYFKDQYDAFGGDPIKAAAAYNAGPGAVQKALSRAQTEGGDWTQYLPAETQNYVAMLGGHTGTYVAGSSGNGGLVGSDGTDQLQQPQTSIFMKNPPLTWDTNNDGKVGFWERIKANPETALKGLGMILLAADGSPQSQQTIQSVIQGIDNQKQNDAKSRYQSSRDRRGDMEADRQYKLQQDRLAYDQANRSKTPPRTFQGPDGKQYYMLTDPATGQQVLDANGAPVVKPVPGVGAKPTTGTGKPGSTGISVPMNADTIRQQVEAIKANPALPRVVGPIVGSGGNNIDELGMGGRAFYAARDALSGDGGDSTALIEQIGQLQGGSWLAARDMLKGGGAITDYESKKAEGAFGRMSRAKSLEEFTAALDEFASAVEEGEAKLRQAGITPNYGQSQQSQSPQSDNSNLPQPQTQEDYDALPQGSQYLAPDGKVRTKQ